MEIDLQTVWRAFDDVLSGRMSREQAGRWACSVVQNEEAGALTYLPSSDKQRIWSGVMYLHGLDAMESPGEYLHTDEDIRAAMKAKLGEL